MNKPHCTDGFLGLMLFWVQLYYSECFQACSTALRAILGIVWACSWSRGTSHYVLCRDCSGLLSAGRWSGRHQRAYCGRAGCVYAEGHFTMEGRADECTDQRSGNEEGFWMEARRERVKERERERERENVDQRASIHIISKRFGRAWILISNYSKTSLNWPSIVLAKIVNFERWFGP